MKKAYGKTDRKFFHFFSLLSVCFIFLTTACGLDVVSVLLDDNVSHSTFPTIDSQYDEMVFSFSTSKLDEANTLGRTYLYYKIYNSSTVLDSEVNSLTNLAGDSNKKYNSASSLLNTYHYQPLQLKVEGTNGDVVSGFELENASHNVKIRLTNYGVEEFSAGIWLDDVKKGVPVRIVKSQPFDFGKENDFLPLLNEDDTKNFVENQAEKDLDFYYVALFSVFMMLDDDFVPIYSPIHCLGSVKINSKLADN